MNVSIGSIIKEITERRGISKSELGRRLNMTPTNVHKIFKRVTIDTGLLEKISEVLEYDFFKHYGEKKSYQIPDNPTSIVEDVRVEYKHALLQCNEKVTMLEKINSLLEEKIKLLEQQGKS